MTDAANIRRQIRDIKAAAFGMGHAPNAGQALRIEALEEALAAIPDAEEVCNRHGWEDIPSAECPGCDAEEHACEMADRRWYD